ncbi:hypothetical protein GAO04_16550 [Bacteroides uniformis]|uniref:Uncharacterized protein n=1 Tax=Bacteroides uniformis TaxID=820 RepID=A0A414WAK4_BACUN|nr:hypothetical protein GAP49_20345 [Bacteroides uniformis]KAB4249160.1 hypothetical protein GAO04_16550 [Bacteroides uniformis]KAB4249610.1 hypothetical protein GAP48_16805 [Bacteroides uniformis]KAB4258181.1 hypothetical protein GAP40_19470 [Bacteroides uniformis]RHH29485.1 hypothetical protein DW216_14635 [Bacteroides uniformis]
MLLKHKFASALLPHFHPSPVSPYSSAFTLRWKQSEKVEAKFASTCRKRLSFAVTYCPLP